MWPKPPVRHSSSTTASSASSAKLSGTAASARITPSASAIPPFMSTAPEPISRSAVALERPVLIVGDDGVEMAEQQHAAGAGAR